MASAGSYKSKLASVVQALEDRTREANAWKTIATHRLESLQTAVGQVADFEASLLKLPALKYVEEAEGAGPMVERITDGPSVNAGVSSIEDVFDQVRDLLTGLSLLTTESAVLLDTESISLTSVGMPDMEELTNDASGLSLAEMRGDGPPPANPITPPPDVEEELDQDDARADVSIRDPRDKQGTKQESSKRSSSSRTRKSTKGKVPSSRK